MEDYNDILIENYILKAIMFNRGISGTTDVIVIAENIFGKIALNKTNSKPEPDHRKHINYSGRNIWWRQQCHKM